MGVSFGAVLYPGDTEVLRRVTAICGHISVEDYTFGCRHLRLR